jgi:hypothetical protein
MDLQEPTRPPPRSRFGREIDVRTQAKPAYLSKTGGSLTCFSLNNCRASDKSGLT